MANQREGKSGTKPLVFVSGEIKSPPFSEAARIETGMLLRRLQMGDMLSMPASRPMPSIGTRCWELRVTDENATWRIFGRTDADAIVVVHVMAKKTEATPKQVIALCKKRFAWYDSL